MSESIIKLNLVRRLGRIRQILVNIVLVIFVASSFLLTMSGNKNVVSSSSIVEFTLGFGWFTVLTYGAGWTHYFREKFYARLLICDVPFILSASFMALLNYKTYQSAEGIDVVLMVIYMWSLFAYLPLSLIYYSILIMGFDILKFDNQRRDISQNFSD